MAKAIILIRFLIKSHQFPPHSLQHSLKVNIMKTRRQFMFHTIPAAISLGLSMPAIAQATHVEESSPAASALGYKNDATKVDTKKYTTYAAGKNCGNCALFQGKSGDAWGACGALGGKQVNAKGWCIAWSKKA
jgi:hypothetical protein